MEKRDEKKQRIANKGIRESIDSFIHGVKDAFKSIVNIDLDFPNGYNVDKSQQFKTIHPLVASVPFSGSITGEFFVCINPQDWLNYLTKLSDLKEDDPAAVELLYSTMKEISNTAAGETIAAIKRTFGPVTMLSPKLIIGTLYYPQTQIFSFTITDSNKQFPVEAKISFDLMEQEINVEHEKLKKDARLDETGLYNKKYFIDFMEQMEKYYRDKGHFSIIFADINRLKYVNDTYGHEAGDNYIKAACNLIRQSCRSTDYCFRIGGDEIVIFVPNTTKEESQPIIERIHRMLPTERIEVTDEMGNLKKIHLDLSVGIASTSEKIPSNAVLATADQRMEQAKKEWYRSKKIQRRK